MQGLFVAFDVADTRGIVLTAAPTRGAIKVIFRGCGASET